MLERILFLFKYNWWANQRILDAIEQLTDEEIKMDLGGSFRSIYETLIHTMWVELLFVRRWQGIPTDDIKCSPTIEKTALVKIQWLDIEKERNIFLEKLDEAKLDEQISYIDTRGRNFTIELWKAIFQCINHSTLHRGQIIGKLRQLNKIPPATDFILFCKENQ